MQSQPMASQVSDFVQQMGERVAPERRWLAILLLAVLHFGLMAEPDGSAARAFLLSHFGLFLLWQPLVSPERRVRSVTVVLLLVCGAAVLFLLRGWALVVWIAVLIGLLGGRGFLSRRSPLRYYYLIAFLYLFLVLLLWAVPKMLARVSVPEGIEFFVSYILPLLFIAMAALPNDKQPEEAQQAVDFFYSLLSFQLALLVALGSLAVMQNTRQDYYTALLFTLAGALVVLSVLALLWNPFAGYPGLRVYFSRYLLSVGMPFEEWLQQLAIEAEQRHDPEQFLRTAAAHLGRLPWIVGGAWKSAEENGAFGSTSAHTASFFFEDLQLKLHSKARLSPANLLHVRLLARLMAEFYAAKRREQQLKQNAYVQAVHETGARLTHDIKNLLQSLMSLTGIGEDLKPEESMSYAQLVQRQLPQLTKRLQLTLEKLQRPAEPVASITATAPDWWQNLRTRYAPRGVEFGASPVEPAPIPRNLFDSVAENLFENALRKRRDQPDVKVSAQFILTPEPVFTVIDTGAAVPTHIERALFRRPVSGSAGTGIGLYHSAQQAQIAGYRLALTRNETGWVAFELAREPAPVATTQT